MSRIRSRWTTYYARWTYSTEFAIRSENLEAPPGFEPGMEVLQTSALPLGDGALIVSR